MKRKILAILLCLTLAFGMVGCSDPAQQPEGGTPGGSQTPQQPQAGPVTIEQGTVLLDQDGLTITAQELVDDAIWGPGVKVLIENNAGQNLGVQCGSLIVNSYMVTSLFSATVTPGNKANETIHFTASELEAAGITTISDIVFSFHVFDADSYETLYDTEEIELQTSAYGSVQQAAMDEGQELVNQDGVRIVVRPGTSEGLLGEGIVLFIENLSGADRMVQCDSLVVNGFMMSPLFSCTVNNGRMALNEITILSSDLEANGIESIEDVELVFKIIDAATYQTIFQTETITFSVG